MIGTGVACDQRWNGTSRLRRNSPRNSMLRNAFSSRTKDLSPENALIIVNMQLDNARNSKEPEIALELCDYADTLLSDLKQTVKKSRSYDSDASQTLRGGIATAYLDHSKLLTDLGHPEKAQVSRKKAEKFGGPSIKRGLNSISGKDTQAYVASIPPNIFPNDVPPPALEWKFPEPDERLLDTPQLVSCLSLLNASASVDDTLEPPVLKWLQDTRESAEEKERLQMLTIDVMRTFIRDELKEKGTVAEILCLAPVLKKDDFRILLKHFAASIIEQTGLLDIPGLRGLAQLIQSASSEYLEADDLEKILEDISRRLKETHKDSPSHVFQLTVAVSHVLDAMADINITTGIKRIEVYEPLLAFLNELRRNTDPHLAYQAAYAFQALLNIGNNESPWQATARRARKAVRCISGLVSAAKGLDLIKLLESLHEGLEGAVQVGQLAYVGIGALAAGGKSLVESFKEGQIFSHKRAWYLAVRGAYALLQEGEHIKFKILVCEAPCRGDPNFQWGICQCLGNLAATSQWDVDSRLSAALFLGQIYRDDIYWGNHLQVKEYILEILQQLSSLPGTPLQIAASLLQDMGKGDTIKKELCRPPQKEGPVHYPLEAYLPRLASSYLLDRVQNKQDVEAGLRRLSRQRLQQQGSTVYIPPQANTDLHASDNYTFDLREKVDEFLGGSNKVLLLLGASGAGKSTFGRELECDLWEAYMEKKDDRIPLFISLPAMDKPEQDLIEKQLRKAKFTEFQIRELEAREFILICDGYDEIQQTHNLYVKNRLNQNGAWKARMIISCRNECLGKDYRDRFQPGDRNHPTDPAQFQQAVLVPFSSDQIENYIERYVIINTPVWRATDYHRVFDQIENLRDLVKNPFLLTLSLEVLPRMIVDPGQNHVASKITRVELYDQFVAQWLERNKKRQGDKESSQQETRAFETLSDEGFTRNGINYLKRLAAAIYKEQEGRPLVHYVHSNDSRTWKAAFFNRQTEIQLLREACPLSRSGNQYQFIHGSLLEYCFSLAVFDPYEYKIVSASPILARRASISSTFSFEEHDSQDDETTDIQESVVGHPLSWKSFVDEPSILQFLAERAQQEPIFKQQLFEMIEQSKTDKEGRIAAANAITILVRARVRFNGADLTGIQIPGADLSNGEFDSAQLQGADLRKVNLRNIWMRQANLSDARMAGVQFGEWSYLTVDSKARSCAYSPDGNACAIGLNNGYIVVYHTTTWEKINSLKCHDGAITSLVYSPRGHQIASGSKDRMVRLWDTQLSSHNPILCIHTDHVTSEVNSASIHRFILCRCGKIRRDWLLSIGHRSSSYYRTATSVVFSPSGQQIASCGSDSTVRLWDAQSGAPGPMLSGHSGLVSCAVYSPSGGQIASCGSDSTVRLWDAQSGAPGLMLTGHSSVVNCVVYSPSGHQIASCGSDSTVRLWDPQSGAPGPILSGHTGHITRVVYSPSGHQIASGSSDTTVRLWDAQSGASGLILDGHTDEILSLVYSPSGHQITSGSSDKTVRLWNAPSGMFGPTLSTHSDAVTSVVCSPSGHQIVSVSEDNTVRFWDAQSGAPGPIISGLAGMVSSVVYSLNGRQIASGCWDNTVRLCDTQTGAPGHILRGHTEGINSVTYSSNDRQIASASKDMTVRLWDTKTGTPGPILSGHTSHVTSVAYSPSGYYIASGSNDNTVRLWDAHFGSPGPILRGHSETVTSVAYSPSGRQIASCSLDNTVRLWDAQLGAFGPILRDHTNTVTSVVYSPHGRQIASGSWDKTVRLWDAQSGTLDATLTGHTNYVTSVVYSPNGHQIASGSFDSTVRLWDVRSGAPGPIFRGHFSTVTSVVYSPSGHQIASGSLDMTVRLWDVQSGAPGLILSGHTDRVRSVVYSPSGHQIASCSSDNTVRLWDALSGAPGYILNGHTNHATSVVYSPSGDWIASGSQDNTVRLWNAQSGASGPLLSGHTDWVRSIVYSPDGHHIASGGSDNTVRVWDAQSGVPGPIFHGHSGSIMSVAYSASGSQIASGSFDKTVRVWDVRSCVPSHTLEGHTHWVTSVVYSPSGLQVASSGFDHTVRVWDAKSGASGLILYGHRGSIKSIMYSPSGCLIASSSSDNTVRLWNTISGQCLAVVEGFRGVVNSVAWNVTGTGTYFVTGSQDKSVRMWQVIEEEDHYKVRLHWSSTHSVLTMLDTVVNNVSDLSKSNLQLLRQLSRTKPSVKNNDIFLSSSISSVM